MDVLVLIVGLALILYGANLLTDGSAALAQRFGVSEFVIGLTVVAIGTSMPELVVSVVSALRGSADMAVGNVVGSNLFNTLLIIGITALISPLPLFGRNLWRDVPFGILAAAILWIMTADALFFGTDGRISRIEGLVLFGCFVGFIFYTIYSSRSEASVPETDGRVQPRKKIIWILLSVVGGLAGLIWGGNLFLDSAVSIARKLGVSDSVIAITLMAGGTSLPELAACGVAAVKGKAQMAMGNVIGSNISNIFLILGVSATITPLQLGDILPFDILMLVISSALLFVAAFTFKKKEVDRIEGLLFILLYVAYIVWLMKRDI